MNVVTLDKNYISVMCAFCEGKGLDPFSIMSPISKCCVCGGEGVVMVKSPYVKCAFCKGTGIYPHSRLECTACGGVGVIHLPEPYKQCEHCRGSGMNPKGDSGLYCAYCHGAGLITGDLQTQ